ncbi:MAG: site-2 protease family protein [Planctomycetota bacterium]
MNNLFISNLVSDNPADRFYFFAVVLVVVFSIVLHELAHGWAAIRLGDPTPRVQGRMTGNPLVHMGPFSLIALALAGIAWGQMPVDSSRLRGRYAEAWVALAGPATNLVIAAVAVITLAVLMRVWGLGDVPALVALFGLFGDFELGDLSTVQQNLLRLLAIAGVYNVVLAMFNLLPAPPLDGSHVLANLHRGYANFIGDPAHQGVHLLLFIGCFMIASQVLFGWGYVILDQTVGWLT